jgi:Ca2+-binding RTX toxin-like protein
VAVTTTDLNGDGRLDLIVDLTNNYQGHYIQLLINHGAAGFVDETPDRMPQATQDDGRWIHSVKAVDLNGDGFVDLIARNGQDPPVFLNDGTGHFVNLPASFLDYGGQDGGTPWNVALNPIDANGDGRMDLLADFVNGEMLLFTQQDPGPSQTGTENADALLGGGSAETLSGLGGNDVLSGGGGNDSLFGGLGADTLIGGAGNDTMRGEGDNDLYVVTNAGDVVIEDAGAGIDTIRSSISVTLGANVENLALTGISALNGTGNALANLLTGNDGANVLNGAGGADTLKGGLGNDTYIVDDAADVTTESSPAGGVDTVQSSVTRALTAYIEKLTLTGTSAINGTGNALANVLTGNDAANILNGGAGADTLKGGLGNDTYIVDNAGDLISESSASGGIDTVQSSVTRVLSANIENLTLAGASAISGTGNALANVIIGNGAANTLNGGAGADSLRGGFGNDIYIVDNSGDVTSENSATGGVDTVVSSVTRTINAYLENLTLTGVGMIDGSGNALDNILTGNIADNILSGAFGADTLDGGRGNDTLVGGGGTDTFLFDTQLNGSSNVDQLTDFRAVDDTIALDRTAFTRLSVGALATVSFYAGTAAHDADDRIIYDSATGQIYYDADGNGAGAQILFAQLAQGTALGYADFLVVT